MSQLMWELVRQSNPETHIAEVAASASDPLWLIAFVPGSEGKVKILAGANQPITEQEKKRVVRLLRGTSKPMTEALTELRLEFPSAYVEKQISEHLVWDNSGKYPEGDSRIGGFWQSKNPTPAMETVKNILHIPKS